jgi:hypothetical protein
MIRLLRLPAWILLIVAFASPAFSQTADTSAGPPTSAFAMPATVFTSSSASQASQPQRRDSLWNGMLIGAGLGAMAGAFTGFAQQNECVACSGFNEPLAYGALGAGIGAGIGAGVDALFHKRASPAGDSPHERRQLRLFPLVSKEVRGLAGRIGF